MNVRTESRPDPGEHLASPVLFAMQGVGKQWPKGPVVLDDVNLDLPAGTVTWIGGTNGAGKTTLLRVAAGLIRPDTGSIRLDGLDPERQRDEFQRRLGFISAVSVGLYARLTVRDHLDFWARLFYLPRAARKEAEARVAEAFGLTDLLDRRVDRLSMGQRQRVRLGGVFVHDPDVVLLDEPHNSLDEPGLDMLRAAIDGIVDSGGAVAWASPFVEGDHLPIDRRYKVSGGRVEAA
jgi:ABC-type multidrug transport system ATPase subunit